MRKHFHTWLRDQQRRGDAVGDLAQDARDDPKLARMVGSKRSLLGYLRYERRACPEAIEAAGQSWNEWDRYRRGAAGLSNPNNGRR